MLMKTIYLFACLLGITLSARAGTGDTVTVQGHNNVVIQTDPSVGETYYTAWSTFPADTTHYRKVMAYLTFECAPGLSCGEWDYLNHIYIGKKGGINGDSLGYELGRFITPYGFYWNSNDNWKHGWWLDITDWSYLLHDSVQIVYKHTGYESNADRGWKINLKYYVIEGNPVRNFKKMDTLWQGVFQYGNPANNIESKLDARNIVLDAATATAKLWIMQTGHGNDKPGGCGEFCAKNRYVKWDNTTINTRNIWKECGFNSLFPQAGTWILDRANWCPGQTVQPDWIEIPGLSGGTAHTIDIDMQPYTGTQDFGNMFFATYLFEYGAPNAQTDVSLETIISPSTDYEYNRLNPVCGRPVIRIKNNGAQPLTALDVEYGLAGQPKATYHWTGNLPFAQYADITLANAVQYIVTTDATFEVELKNPNGATDEYTYDNKTSSILKPTPVLPAAFVVEFKTNKANKEDTYKFIDAQTGQIVHQKSNTSFPAKNTVYRDTVILQKNSCYIFEFSDEGTPLSGGFDINKDGLYFWLWDRLAQDPANQPYISIIDNTAGALQIKELGTNANLRDFTQTTTTAKGAAISGADFGTKIIYQFSTNSTNLSYENRNGSQAEIKVYPVPSANGHFTINYHIPDNKAAMMEVRDISGRLLYEGMLKGIGGVQDIDLSRFSKGIYLLRIVTQGESVSKKLVIQ